MSNHGFFPTRDVPLRDGVGFWIGLLAFSLTLSLLWATPAGLSAQDKDKEADEDKIEGRLDPYDPLIELRKVDYVPAKTKKGRQTLRFTFNVNPDVPKGARINFELEYNALPFDNTNYVLEGQKRRGLQFEWSPKKRMAIDEYYLRVRMYPNDQTPTVKKAIERNPRKFPVDFQPWPWLYFNQPVKVGTPEELRAQRDAMCDLYGKYMDRLVANYAEFHEKMDKVKAGELAVNGTTLNQKAFEKIIVDWRKKQGELQQEIQEMPVNSPVFATKSITAYTELTRLGCMVSKACVKAQNAVETQYGVDSVRPEKQHRFFNPVYRYTAGKQQLNDKLKRIEELVCAHLLQEQDAEAAKGDEKKGDEKKGDEKKGDEKKGDEKKGDEKSKKTGSSKRSSKNSTSGSRKKS